MLKPGVFNKLAITNETKAIAESKPQASKAITNEVLAEIYDDIDTLEVYLEHQAGHIVELKHQYDDLKAMLNNFNMAIERMGHSGQVHWENAINAIDTTDAANAKKFGKLHICPDCGAALHLHRLENQGNIWHLECVSCGYYSQITKQPFRSKPGKHPIPVNDPVAYGDKQATH